MSNMTTPSKDANEVGKVNSKTEELAALSSDVLELALGI